MGLAFGILLFVLTYGSMAYVIYDELKRRGPGGSARPATSPRRHGARRLRAAGQYQH